MRFPQTVSVSPSLRQVRRWNQQRSYLPWSWAAFRRCFGNIRHMAFCHWPVCKVPGSLVICTRLNIVRLFFVAICMKLIIPMCTFRKATKCTWPRTSVYMCIYCTALNIAFNLRRYCRTVHIGINVRCYCTRLRIDASLRRYCSRLHIGANLRCYCTRLHMDANLHRYCTRLHIQCKRQFAMLLYETTQRRSSNTRGVQISLLGDTYSGQIHYRRGFNPTLLPYLSRTRVDYHT